MAAVQQDPAADQFYWCPSRTPFSFTVYSITEYQ